MSSHTMDLAVYVESCSSCQASDENTALYIIKITECSHTDDNCSTAHLPEVIVTNKADLFSWHYYLFISNTSDNVWFKQNSCISAHIRNR